MTQDPQNRPLSPHLTIYRPQLNSVLSIMHRITGIVLFVGLVLLILWFFSLALGQAGFELFGMLINSLIGRLILIGSLCALWYHFFAGVRHLFWDIGIGFNLLWVKRSSYAVIIATISLTIISLVIGVFSGWYSDLQKVLSPLLIKEQKVLHIGLVKGWLPYYWFRYQYFLSSILLGLLTNLLQKFLLRFNIPLII